VMLIRSGPGPEKERFGLYRARSMPRKNSGRRSSGTRICIANHESRPPIPTCIPHWNAPVVAHGQLQLSMARTLVAHHQGPCVRSKCIRPRREPTLACAENLTCRRVRFMGDT